MHPNSRFVPPRAIVTRNTMVVIVIILLVTGGIVGYLIYAQSQQNIPPPYSGLLGTPISGQLYQNVSAVSFSILSSIGSSQNGVTAPTASPSHDVSQLLGPNGKPEVLYIGDEWCPFCAAERWALVVALSKFGNFSNLKYMESSSSDLYPDTFTFSFENSSYQSQYISFVPIEHEDRNHNVIQPTTPQEQSIWGEYTSGQMSIPFVYIDGQYYLTGAQYSPSTISNMNWTQIASQLDNPQSTAAKQIDGSANQLIGTICTVLKSRGWPYPNNLCSQSFATVSYSTSGFGSYPNFSLISDMNTTGRKYDE
jgi:hypothetical protein